MARIANKASRTVPIKATQPAILTDEECEAIRKKAADEVQKERAQAAAKEFLQDAIDLERAKYAPEFVLVPVTIDLPGYASYMLIDGHFFYHGETVTVTQAQKRSMDEQMYNMWHHERVSGNPNSNSYIPVKRHADPVSGDVIARM